MVALPLVPEETRQPMPVNQTNYDHRGGGNYGIVVRCSNIVGNRLVYFDHNAQRHSWVIRDFMTGQQLSNNESTLTVSQIEADADFDEFPPWSNVENLAEWTAYMSLRTTAVFQLRTSPETSLPNPDSGNWQNL